MKTFFYALGGIILLGLIIWGFASLSKPASSSVQSFQAGDPSAPKAEMTEKKFDFGKIKPSDIAKHDFKIKNTGKSPLMITSIITSCHCATAILKVPGKADSPEFGMHQHSNWQGEIAPEEEADVLVIYEPAKMPVKGQVSRVITLATNDPSSQEIQLEVIANVE